MYIYFCLFLNLYILFYFRLYCELQQLNFPKGINKIFWFRKVIWSTVRVLEAFRVVNSAEILWLDNKLQWNGTSLTSWSGVQAWPDDIHGSRHQCSSLTDAEIAHFGIFCEIHSWYDPNIYHILAETLPCLHGRSF